MKIISAFVLALSIAAPVLAQWHGIIECQNQDGIPALEQPGSLVVARQLSCGQDVTILGLDRGYVKVQIKGNLFGFVEAKYVRTVESRDASSQGMAPSRSAEPGKQVEASQQSAPAPVRTTIRSQRSSGEREGTIGPRFGLGFEISHIKYREPVFPMQESGVMWGVSGNYTYRPKNYMFRLDGRFSSGDVDYTSPSGSFDNIRDYNFETRFSLGRAFRAAERTRLTPFVGLGYRFLFDDLSSAPGGYDRKSNYLYSPIGLEGLVRLRGSWSLGASGEYDLFWHGWQYSGSGDYVAKNDQKNGWGARGSIGVIKSLGRMDFAIEPYLRFWNIKNSDTTYVLSWAIHEPANRSLEWGTRLGMRF
jgi:hypothetical protein